MSLQSEQDVEAMEYVLGLMDREERAEFEVGLLDDPVIADAVWAQEEAFRGFADAVPRRQAPQRVWKGVEDKVFAGGSAKEARPSFWLRVAAGVFGGATILAATALAVILLEPTVLLEPKTQYVAAIVQSDDRVTLARVNANGRVVTQALPLGTNGVPQLWFLPPGEDPVPIGLMDQNAASEFDMPPELRDFLTSGQFAISVEPEGGSPTGQPTGPIIGVAPVSEL